jgi:putative GTP pyrophosphokinase
MPRKKVQSPRQDALTKEATSLRYRELQPKYGRLAALIAQALETFLHDTEIDFLSITHRVKNFDSLWDKIERKRYSQPFDQTEDLCGLRIICFYPSDLEKISALIRKEFVVTESVDKAELLEPDRFGYRSFHFVVKLKKDWLSAPQYRGLGDFKAEIQVRTILMHAWAGLSHKLAYKKKEGVPDQFQRKLFQLSALFEIADQQFDELQKEKYAYQEKLLETKKTNATFDISQPLNIDSLQAYLQFYFPERKMTEEISSLFDNISRYGVTIKDLVSGYERVREILPEVERNQFGDTKPHWHQGGIVRVILDLTHDPYWMARRTTVPDSVAARTEKWRKKLSRQKASR